MWATLSVVRTNHTRCRVRRTLNLLTHLLTYLRRDTAKMSKKRRQSSRHKKHASHKTAANKSAMDAADLEANRTRQTSRDEDRDKEQDNEEDERGDEEEKEAEMERYNEFLVKKDINDYFAQSKNAADEQQEVFDRSERDDAASDRSGKPVITILLPSKLRLRLSSV